MLAKAKDVALRLVFTCPTTGAKRQEYPFTDLSTNLHESRAYYSVYGEISVTVGCNACGKTHEILLWKE